MLGRFGLVGRVGLGRAVPASAAPALASGGRASAWVATTAVRRRELWTGVQTWTLRGGLTSLTSAAACRNSGGMIRGWAAQRAAAIRPVVLRKRGFAGGGTVNPNGAFYERHPVLIAVFVATIKTAAADIIVQTQIEGCESVDWRRVGLFTAFGACYF
eukprot:COSAG02_NODE_5223_length_4527_cov_35.869919_4_plen_157_part_01